jgi:hypothetical protein
MQTLVSLRFALILLLTFAAACTSSGDAKDLDNRDFPDAMECPDAIACPDVVEFPTPPPEVICPDVVECPTPPPEVICPDVVECPTPPPEVTLAELAGTYVFGPGSRAVPVDPITGALDFEAAIDLENEEMTVTVNPDDTLTLVSDTIGTLRASPVLHEQAAFTQIPDQTYTGIFTEEFPNPDAPDIFRGLDPLSFTKKDGVWGISSETPRPWRSEVISRAGRKYELQVRCCPRTS